MYIFLPRSVHAFVAEKGFVLGGELWRQNEVKVITINIPLQVTWANLTRDNSYLKVIKKLHWHKIYDAYQIDDTILYNERKELN